MQSHFGTLVSCLKLQSRSLDCGELFWMWSSQSSFGLVSWWEALNKGISADGSISEEEWMEPEDSAQCSLCSKITMMCTQQSIIPKKNLEIQTLIVTKGIYRLSQRGCFPKLKRRLAKAEICYSLVGLISGCLNHYCTHRIAALIEYS